MTAGPPEWSLRAACTGTPITVFFPQFEDQKDLEFVQDRYCNHCPVRVECLNDALVHSSKGFWGGTATAEREKLARVRNRVKCPLCRGDKLIGVPGDLNAPDLAAAPHHYKICLACGVSWPVPEVPVPVPVPDSPLPSSGLSVEPAPEVPRGPAHDPGRLDGARRSAA